MNEVTRALSAIQQGDPHAAEQLLPLVYDELRRLAATQLAHEKPGQTLEATALVHEAYLRLVGAQQFVNRRHFFAAAAQAMRRILIESARRRQLMPRVDLAGLEPAAQAADERLLELHETLERLAVTEPMAAKVVEARVFAGLSVEEAAATRRLLILDGTLTGRGAGVNQPGAHFAQRLFAGRVALARRLVAKRTPRGPDGNLPQPGSQLGHARPPKSREMLMSFEEYALNQVRIVEPGLDTPGAQGARNDADIRREALEQPSQRLVVPGTSLDQGRHPLLGVHGGLSSLVTVELQTSQKNFIPIANISAVCRFGGRAIVAAAIPRHK